jgi:hypothetical protein
VGLGNGVHVERVKQKTKNNGYKVQGDAFSVLTNYP